ncbi:Protein YIM1 [Candida viswanathii]|uniref:Protein YIM1 n=1 Tax=Candida viswanathii TaxID=5486 RepID=A0A367XNL0_9ASCO|nr:Protein YIM1 [Candida viswanathii]
MSETIEYKRWAFRHGGTPLKIIDDKFNFPKDAQGNLVIPENDILVKIHFASVNPIDSKLHHIMYFAPFINHGIGKDFSGEIVALGSNIRNFKVGEYVQGFHPGALTFDGTFSEYVLINTNLLIFNTEIARVPDNISLEEAAAWPLVFGTAILMIYNLPIKGKKVLVLGAATSVGRYLTQLLRVEGASEIVASCSPRSQDLVEELGATKIVNYRKNVLNQVLESAKDQPFDYILDCWGGTELFPHIDHVLVKGGVYHSIVGDIPGSGAFPFVWGTLKSLARTVASWVNLLDYSYSYVFLGTKNTGWIPKAQQYIASGQIKIFVDKVYDFEDLPKAIEYIESGHAQGKLVIKVAKD